MKLKLFLILELYIKTPVSLFSLIIKATKLILIILLTTSATPGGAQWQLLKEVLIRKTKLKLYRNLTIILADN
jgi:hypothetical protein